MVAETHGNPFALLELSRELTSAQLAGDSVLPRSFPLSARHEGSLMRRLRGLPDETLVFLLLVAAQPDGDSDVILRAADLLGLGNDASGPAREEGLVRIGPPTVFQPQFVGTAVYAAASPAQRRAAHSALAAATDQDTDIDGYAWHRAAAASSPDVEVAAALEHAALRARPNLVHVGAAALLERAAELTPDVHRRVDRNLAAVRAELDSGGVERAGAMLDAVGEERMDDLQRVRAKRLRVEIEVEAGTAADAHAMLLDVARALEPLDRRQARDAHLEALKAGLEAGRPGAAADAQDAPRASEAGADARDLLVEGFSSLFDKGHGSVAPTFRRAIELLRDDDDLESLALGCYAAIELWDDEALHDLTVRRMKLARSSGALFELRRALVYRGAAYEVLVGRLDVAERCLDEAEEIAAATLSPPAGDHVGPGRLQLAAWRGREIDARRLAEAIYRSATARGDLRDAGFTHLALALLDVGLGRYRAALSAAREASLGEVNVVNTWALPELVEAAARSGEFAEAAGAAERLADSALAGSTNWGLGMLARSRALASQSGNAEELYREAIDRLGRGRARLHFARAKLVYGEWLRRERRRKDAREQLREAHELLSAMGAGAFAERARAELLATGEHTRRWSTQTMDLLTPQEARIAHLAADGATNADIATQLFISPRTVEYHLSKVFRKFDVRSRTQLTRALLEREQVSTED
jgi:DNA-binding CsgD family transcriptional regulator